MGAGLPPIIELISLQGLDIQAVRYRQAPAA